MGFLVEMMCDKCSSVTDMIFKDYEDWKQKDGKINCSICKHGGHFSRVYLTSPAIDVKENCDPVSCKPSSYWRNAERNRVSNLERNKKVEQEKKFYGDKTARRTST